MKAIVFIDQETLDSLPMQGFTLYCAGEYDKSGQLNISARTKAMMNVDALPTHQQFELIPTPCTTS